MLIKKETRLIYLLRLLSISSLSTNDSLSVVNGKENPYQQLPQSLYVCLAVDYKVPFAPPITQKQNLKRRKFVYEMLSSNISMGKIYCRTWGLKYIFKINIYRIKLKTKPKRFYCVLTAEQKIE